jgi:cytochrome c
MDSWEWNKIAGAVLGTFMFVLVVKIATEKIFEVPEPAKPGYVVEGVKEETSAGPAVAAAVEEAIPDWGTELPKASASDGKQISARCEQCHDLSKGGPNKIGPNLWGVVGRPRASHPGFEYSSAMKAKGGSWTYDELFKFLKSPGSYIPGTKMSFAGLRSAQDRINLLAYLRTQSDSPVPIPPPAPAKPASASTGSAPASVPSAPGTTPPQGPNGTSAVAPSNTPPPGNAPSGGAKPGATTPPATPADGQKPPKS